MRIAVVLLLAAAQASGLGCHSPSAPKGAATITGVVVARDVQISIGGPPSVHVKESPQSECGIVFLLRPSTSLLRRTDQGRLVNASVDELTVGRSVSVWTNVVLDSCPGQAGAETIVLLPASP